MATQRLFQARLGFKRSATALALLGAFACKQESEQKPLTSDTPSAEPTTTAPVISPEIAEAVAQAASSEPAAEDGAPPEDGILDPARAEREAPAGAPAKVVLGSAGEEPKLQLGGPEITDARIGQLTVSVRTGPQSGMPSVDYRVEATGKAREGSPAHDVALEVVEASLAQQQPGAIPEDLQKAIQTLKGSTLRYQTQAGVRFGDIAVEPGKKTDESIGSLLSAASHALSTVVLSYPKEPVGKGGFWLITAREKLSLAEVVGYHLVKVENIENQRVTLSVDTRRYLVGNEFQGLPAMQFVGSASTDLVVLPGHRLPIEGRTQQTLQALVQSQQGPRPVQYELRSLFAFPPKQDEAAAAAGGIAPAATP